ncbi:MAG: MoaD/ThiS family protein [Planctomycetes bacterium]|nr:MoaD/ThiS family protein [Planctomycetota bacterium]
MKITIEYFGPAREAAGLTREVVETDADMSAHRLIGSLAKSRGGRLASLLLAVDGSLSTSVLLAIGDRQVGPGEDVALREGDEILVISPISGG